MGSAYWDEDLVGKGRAGTGEGLSRTDHCFEALPVLPSNGLAKIGACLPCSVSHPCSRLCSILTGVLGFEGVVSLL